MNLTKIDIIICCYNSEKYLRDTLDSIINQTYKKWQIIIVDDGSTDNTKEIVYDYISRSIPITYHRNNVNMGFGKSRQIAFKLCTNEWIAILDHDDIWYPYKLELQVNSIVENPEAKLFFSNSEWFNDNEKILRLNLEKNKYSTGLIKNSFNTLLLDGCIIDTETVIINRLALESIGGFDRNYFYITDYDVFLKISSRYEIYYDDNILAKWRVHENQASQKMKSIMIEEHIKLFESILKNYEVNQTVRQFISKKLVNLYRAFASTSVGESNFIKYIGLLLSGIKYRPFDPITYLKVLKTCLFDIKKLVNIF